MDEAIESRLRAMEFLLAHHIARTRSIEDIKADCEELRSIAESGEALRLMIELSPSQGRLAVEAAADLLDEALFQATGD